MNAFYAARVAVVTHVLERWIDLAVVAAAAAVGGGKGARGGSDDGASSRRGIVNVVVLGCGMDACGIWSARLSRGRRSGARVYEFDSRDNCDSRRRALVGSGLLIESSPPPSRWCAVGRGVDDDGVYDGGEDTGCHPPPTSTPFRVVSRGRIVVEDDGGCEDDRNDVDDDYFLVSLDLRGSCPLPPPGDDGGGGGGGGDRARRESALSRALRDVGFDPSRPTFVLSELVLSYLGRDGADAIMRAIAEDALGGNGHSMFACLEPAFPPDDDAGGGGDGGGRARTVSVEGSYSVDYGRQFLGKLRRGESRRRAARGADANADAVDPSSSWLHPLGRDPGGARLRLEGCGFPPSGVCHATLGRAASVVAGVRRTAPVGGAPGFLRAKEPFDEHAALTLNLGCYVIACAFSSSAGPDPPSTDATTDDEGAVAGRRREICPWWEPEDRGVIGPSSAFRIRPISSAREDGRVRELYGRLYAHLYDAHPAIRRMVQSAMRRDLGLDESNVADLRSAVRDRFRLRGGDFWIATDADQRRLVGFIGIGPREERVADERGPISSPSAVVGYEIHRLAVDECYRGMGVGTSLLSMAEEWARGQQSRSKSGTNVTVKLRAVTPDCMTAANKLYESFAYAREETFRAGSIPMNVYCKSLHLL